MSIPHAKYVHPIPISPKVLTHFSIKSNLNIKSKAPKSHHLNNLNQVWLRLDLVHPERIPLLLQTCEPGNKSVIPPISSHLRYLAPFSMPSFFLLQVPTFMFHKLSLIPQPHAWDELHAEMAKGEAKDWVERTLDWFPKIWALLMAPLWASGRSQQTYSVKVQRGNIFGFENYAVSVATMQLCCCSAKAATGNA